MKELTLEEILNMSMCELENYCSTQTTLLYEGLTFSTNKPKLRYHIFKQGFFIAKN